MSEVTVDLEMIEKRAEEIEGNSPFTHEQSRVLACKLEGLSHGETAEMLDKNPDTVRSTWYKCRQAWAEVVWARHHLSAADFGFGSDADALDFLQD